MRWGLLLRLLWSWVVGSRVHDCLLKATAAQSRLTIPGGGV
jgi:hypothetical protein